MSMFFAEGLLRYQEGAWRDDNGDAVEIQLVRHGRWAYTHHMSSMACVTGHVRCTACNRMRTRLIGDVLKYCPNCGAKMRGDSHAD